MIEQQQQKNEQKGLIYLLMGYLGSGKTTFIRNILNNKAGKKYAIIQNQFASGQMGIEQPLIMDQSGIPFSNFLQLPNGCICCSAKNDLIASIEYILCNTSVRHIIVETNGLADPSQSIKQFWFDQQMKINGELHSVISIFSLVKFDELKNKQIYQKQIIFANKVLLTFIDKAQQQNVQKLVNYIQDINKQCQIQRQIFIIQQKRNDKYNIVSFLQGQRIFDMNQFAINYKTFTQVKQQQKLKSYPIQSQNMLLIHKKAHHNIQSIFFTSVSIPLRSKIMLQQCIGQLLWQTGYKILRMKGIFSLLQQQFILQLQAVDDLFQIKYTKTNKLKYNQQSKILIIGQNIEGQKDNIKKILKM